MASLTGSPGFVSLSDSTWGRLTSPAGVGWEGTPTNTTNTNTTNTHTPCQWGQRRWKPAGNWGMRLTQATGMSFIFTCTIFNLRKTVIRSPKQSKFSKMLSLATISIVSSQHWLLGRISHRTTDQLVRNWGCIYLYWGLKEHVCVLGMKQDN